MHPDKVLGALQQHIEAGHEKSALQAIPDLQLQHPQFHNELEQQKARLSARLAEGVQVLDRKSAEVFRCVNCGGGLARQNPESTHVICQYCGCNAEHPANDIHLERWNTALDLESNFTIGDFFQYNDQRWQSSWWMLNERRELAWLIDDGKKRYWADKYTPEVPFNPKNSDKKYEHGQWKLEFAAGEFSYQPVQGELHHSAELARMTHLPIRPGGDKIGYHVSVETRFDSNEKPKEIEFEVKRWKNSIRALIASLPLLVGVMFFLNRGGEQQTNSADLTVSSKEVPIQTIVVEKAGTTLAFNGSINKISNNSWMGVNLELQNSEGDGIYGKYLEFWRESGRDSDGPWTESKRSIGWHIRVDEPGTYAAFVSAEPSSTNIESRFTLKAEPNRVSFSPFFMAGIFTFFMIMVFRSKLSSISSVAASIAVKLKRRFDPAGKPKRKAGTAAEQMS